MIYLIGGVAGAGETRLAKLILERDRGARTLTEVRVHCLHGRIGYELNGDGRWAPLMPGPMTERLYRLAAD